MREEIKTSTRDIVRLWSRNSNISGWGIGNRLDLIAFSLWSYRDCRAPRVEKRERNIYMYNRKDLLTRGYFHSAKFPFALSRDFYHPPVVIFSRVATAGTPWLKTTLPTIKTKRCIKSCYRGESTRPASLARPLSITWTCREKREETTLLFRETYRSSASETSNRNAILPRRNLRSFGTVLIKGLSPRARPKKKLYINERIARR